MNPSRAKHKALSILAKDKFIAKDSDGEWYLYFGKPKTGEFGFLLGAYIHLSSGIPDVNWEETCYCLNKYPNKFPKIVSMNAMEIMRNKKYIAQDKDGAWWLFFGEPTLHIEDWTLDDENLNDAILIHGPTDKINLDWKSTLTEI